MNLSFISKLFKRVVVEKKEQPLEDNIVKLRNDVVLVATTDDFKTRQEEIGNFLPKEQEEETLKIQPKKATDGAAAYDLKAFIDNYTDSISVKSGETKLIKTGFKWVIPNGHAGLVCSRSGLALKNSVFVLNAPGIIDSDYRGDVGVLIHNAGKTDFIISNGDRIAQMMIIPTSNLPLVRVIDIDVTDTVRGTGGFGSTGK